MGQEDQVIRKHMGLFEVNIDLCVFVESTEITLRSLEISRLKRKTQMTRVNFVNHIGKNTCISDGLVCKGVQLLQLSWAITAVPCDSKNLTISIRTGSTILFWKKTGIAGEKQQLSAEC